MQSIVFTAYFAERQVLSVALAGGSHVIGRSPACQIIIPHDSVSRRHARLSIAGSDVVVTDLNSRNGTFLNGTRLSAHRPYQIRDGDEIRLGQMVMRVFYQTNAGRK